MQRFRLVVLLWFTAISGGSQEVIQLTWPTRSAAQPVTLAPAAAAYLPTFRAALGVLPESSIVALALSQPAFLGLTPTDAQSLQAQVGERYRQIGIDPVFKLAPSALPYCFAERTPTNGLALLYQPKDCTSNTPSLLFLHGYGGSFLWYQHLLAEMFPDRIIICPAYGISPATIPVAYVNECVRAAERHLGQRIAAPALVGLSAGGFGAARLYAHAPELFSSLTLIASYPPADILPRFRAGMDVFAISGGNEDYVRSGLFRRSLESIRSKAATVQFEVLPNANHYFLLARREETMKLLRSWLK